MNVAKCKNGHFFDADTYSVCPHCGEGLGDSTEQLTNEKPKKSFLGNGKKGAKSARKTPSVQPVPLEWTKRSDVDNSPTDVLPQRQSNSTSTLLKGETLDFWNYPSHNSQSEEAPEVDTVAPDIMSTCDLPATGDSPQKPIHSDVSTNSLAAVVKEATGNRDGKTVGYFSSMAGSSAETTTTPIEPIVGWLVCVKGRHFGESFCVFSGKNSIGRGDNNRIVVANDTSISREKHALIIYEHKKRDFYLQPGDSSGLTYLNDEFITEQKKLADRDVVELGESKFIFIPLCDENFSWEDYISKE